MEKTKNYGRLYSSVDFFVKPGQLYEAMVNFYTGQNQIAKTVPYYEMAAQEALDNEVFCFSGNSS